MIKTISEWFVLYKARAENCFSRLIFLGSGATASSSSTYRTYVLSICRYPYRRLTTGHVHKYSFKHVLNSPVSSHS